MPHSHIFPLPKKFVPIWNAIQTPLVLARILQDILPESMEAPLTSGNIAADSLKILPETRGHFPMVEFSVCRGEEEILECEVMLCTNEERNYPLYKEAMGRLSEERKHRDANCFSKRSESIKKTVHIWIQLDTQDAKLQRFGVGSFAGFMLLIPEYMEALEDEPSDSVLLYLRRLADGEPE